jgi:hypothetical protein
MGFTDKMCYEVAKDIIDKMFWVKYNPTIMKEKSWYDNLNNFIVKEWMDLKDTDEEESQFNEDEEHAITSDAMQILCDKIIVDDDEWEDHEEDVSWDIFDEIIGHYICQYKPKMYGLDGKEMNINQYCPPAAGGG